MVPLLTHLPTYLLITYLLTYLLRCPRRPLFCELHPAHADRAHECRRRRAAGQVRRGGANGGGRGRHGIGSCTSSGITAFTTAFKK